MNIVDALIIRSLPRVGDSTLTKVLKFASENSISTLEELSKIGSLNFPSKSMPSSLREYLKKQDFTSDRTNIEKNLSSWLTSDIKTIVLGSENYPKQLLDLDTPPPFLFCKGNIELLKSTLMIAVVGTRKNTSIGEQITSKTVEAFANFGFSIVSGLALGIDTIAHYSAINCNAPTIAVLVDVMNVAPSTNRALADKIVEKGGLLVAENPPGTQAIPAFFMKRDRIQAGLSTAVFAIETSIDGGTMHAVNAALSMKRPVYVPDAKAIKRYTDLKIPALSGTQQLINDKKAEPYTRESYEAIAIKLKEVANQICSSFQNELDL